MQDNEQMLFSLLYIHNKRSVLRRQSRDTNRNIKTYVGSVLPIWIV